MLISGLSQAFHCFPCSPFKSEDCMWCAGIEFSLPITQNLSMLIQRHFTIPGIIDCLSSINTSCINRILLAVEPHHEIWFLLFPSLWLLCKQLLKCLTEPSLWVGSNYSINIPMPPHSPTGVELCCIVQYHPGNFPEYLCKFHIPQLLCLAQCLYTKVIQEIANVGFVSRSSKLRLMFYKFPCQKAQHKHTVTI